VLNSFTSLPFCDIGNALCNTSEVCRLLLDESRALCHEKKIKKMNLRGEMSVPSDHLKEFVPENHNKVRMTMNLPGSSESLMNGFKSKLRSQIRKAQQNGLTFSWANDANLHGYYCVFSQNMRDLGSPVHSRKWFQCIMKHYGQNAKMAIVHYEHEIVGGCILLAAGKTIAIPWASTLRKYNKLAPNMLLYWNVLQYAADAGFTTFDFGRSSEGEGTYKFKKQWGATPTPLDWYSFMPSSDQASPSDSQADTSKKQKIAQIWSRIPIPLANLLGPRIRRYISL
jgi:FemAB-related protein (PEP-CTERM system-associated)